MIVACCLLLWFFKCYSLLMRWSRVRIAHDPPQRSNKNKQLARKSDCFFYVQNLLTRDLRDLDSPPRALVHQFQHGNNGR